MALWAQVYPNLIAWAVTAVPTVAFGLWRLDRRAHRRHQHLSAAVHDAVRQAINGPEEDQ